MRFTQSPEVRTCQLDVDAEFAGQQFNCFLALSQQLHNFQSFRAGNRLAYARHLLIKYIFELSFVHANILVIDRILAVTNIDFTRL